MPANNHISHRAAIVPPQGVTLMTAVVAVVAPVTF